MCAVLWEYKDRGQKGYDLTEKFFNLFRNQFPTLSIEGPERAGADILLSKVFCGYPNDNRPVDFLIRNSNGVIKAIGFARYDGDRGGAQEDDRTGGYANCVKEILGFAKSNGLDLKIIFINDGPGLLLGSMWNDYSKIESIDYDHIRVVTLRMVNERINLNWLK